jgi:hypothetical protein
MVAHPRPNAEADYPRPIFAPSISPKINTRPKSKGRACHEPTPHCPLPNAQFPIADSQDELLDSVLTMVEIHQ